MTPATSNKRVVSSTEESVQEDEGAKGSLKILHIAPNVRCSCGRKDTRENQAIVHKNNFYSLLFNRDGQIGDKSVTDYTRCGCRRPMRDIPRIRKTKNPNKDKDKIREFNKNLDELEQRLKDAYNDYLNTEKLELKKTKGLAFIPKKINKIYESLLSEMIKVVSAFIQHDYDRPKTHWIRGRRLTCLKTLRRNDKRDRSVAGTDSNASPSTGGQLIYIRYFIYNWKTFYENMLRQHYMSQNLAFDGSTQVLSSNIEIIEH
ncbi:unnamed protein product [Leptidea sinapis]|uniref:Uncharacterized protein n=1 Tax=Leptidea sinapis TaxID=189913 RepID=A0A5E4QEZ7_9NEOP|nr:unnamed protein product [Leptidea sinapis]